MLRKKDKQTLTRLFLLGSGAPIGLDRLNKGNVIGGFLAIFRVSYRVDNIIGLVCMDRFFYFQNFSFAETT